MLYPETAQQPAKSSTGLWLVIGGGVLAMLLFCVSGGVLAYLTFAPDSGTPTSAPSRRGPDNARCLVGSWNFPQADAMRSAHGGPELLWKHEKGEIILTLSADGTARIENNRELTAVDSAGAGYRNKLTGAATFTYRVNGTDISYGPVNSTGRSYLYVNDVLQGESQPRQLWSSDPEQVDCFGPSMRLHGETDGTPYVQEFFRVAGGVGDSRPPDH